MSISELGLATYHTRVEAWECDHNQHWNVRNYLRVFGHAGHVVADICGAPGAVGPVSLHARFHRELFEASMVLIRSAVVADGQFAGAIVHILSSGGRLSATGMEQSGYAADKLPKVSAEAVALALPRGVDGARHVAGTVELGDDAWHVEHGMVQPTEVDHTGTLAYDQVMRRIATASSGLLDHLGFNPDFVRTQKISRMGVEIKITRLAHIPVGTRLSGRARIASAGSKSVVVHHSLFGPDGTEYAAADQCLVAVDMKTRRATQVPDFLRAAAPA